MMGDLSRHFSRVEFKCACGACDCDTVDSDLLTVLEFVREHFKKRVTVTSGHRCLSHNKSIGGSPRSQHLKGRAADIIVDDVDPSSVYEFLDSSSYRNDISIGKYETFTHIDTRTDSPKRW